MRDCAGSGVKCKRRMANSTGSVRELWLWTGPGEGGEAFGECSADAREQDGLTDKGVVDGFEEELEDFEDAGDGNERFSVEFGD